MSFLRNLFTSKATKEKYNTLKHLSEALDTITQELPEILDKEIKKIQMNYTDKQISRIESGVNDKSNVFQCYDCEKQVPSFVNEILAFKSYTYNIDTSNLTKKDLSTITDKFTALHNVALNYNVRLNFSGFDTLPTREKNNSNSPSSWHTDPHISIQIDHTRPYSEYQHPLFSTQPTEKEKTMLKCRNSAIDRLV